MTIAEKRKANIGRARGLLLLIFAAYFYYLQYDKSTEHIVAASVFIFLYMSSWIVFMLFPVRFYERLSLQYLIFILDIAFVTAGIYLLQIAGVSFYMTIFMLIFIAAIARSTKLSILIGIIGCVSYLFLVGNTPLSLDIFQSSEYLALPFLFLVTLLSGYMAAESEHEQQRQEADKSKVLNIFSKYVPSSVVDLALANEAMELEPERRELTVFFSRIANFASLVETMDSEMMVTLLNEYYSEMVKVIAKHGGTLDKFTCDGIMAIFGAPKYHPQHPSHAVMASIDMDEKGEKMFAEWKQKGLPAFEIGMAVNTGAMTVGNIGAEYRHDYTVLGDSVNTCSRMTGLTNLYGVRKIIGETTYQETRKSVSVRELDWIRAKGKRRTITIYELVGDLRTDKSDWGTIKNYQRGLEHYRLQNWDEAVHALDAILKIDYDGPSDRLKKRCLLLKKSPPPPDWDGVYEMQTK